MEKIKEQIRLLVREVFKESLIKEGSVREVPEPKKKDIVTKPKYKKGDYIYFRIWHPASTMMATSKSELSKSVFGGIVDRVTKDYGGDPKYIVGYEDVRHSQVIGSKK